MTGWKKEGYPMEQIVVQMISPASQRILSSIYPSQKLLVSEMASQFVH